MLACNCYLNQGNSTRRHWIYFVSPQRTTVMSACIPDEDACYRVRNLHVFSRFAACVLGALSDVTVVLEMRQSIAHTRENRQELGACWPQWIVIMPSGEIQCKIQYPWAVSPFSDHSCNWPEVSFFLSQTLSIDTESRGLPILLASFLTGLYTLPFAFWTISSKRRIKIISDRTLCFARSPHPHNGSRIIIF